MLDPAALIKLHHLDVIEYAVDSEGATIVKARCAGREVDFIIYGPPLYYVTRKVSGRFGLTAMPPWWTWQGSSVQIMSSAGLTIAAHEEGFANFDVWWDTEEADLAPLIGYAIWICTSRKPIGLSTALRSPINLAREIRALWLAGDPKIRAAMPGLYRDGTP